MFLVWSTVIIEEAWKYVCLLIEKTMQLILHVKPSYFISQNKDMSRGVIWRWFGFVRPIMKHRIYLLVIWTSAKMQISKKQQQTCDSWKILRKRISCQLKHGENGKLHFASVSRVSPFDGWKQPENHNVCTFGPLSTR